MEAQVRTARELAGAGPQGTRTTLPAIFPAGEARVHSDEARVPVLLRGASMWVLEAALAAGAIATALLLGIGR